MGIKKFNAVQGFSVGETTIYDVVDINANVSANNLTVTGTTNLGAISNLTITGGSAGYVLKTNGSGVLSWENPLDVGVTGSNTQIQFNDNGAFGASANLTFDKTSNTLTVDKIVANGASLTSLNGANVTGTVGNANYAAYAANVTGRTQSNITLVGTLANLNVSGNISSGGNLTSANANLGYIAVASYFYGDGSNLSAIYGPNVTDVVANANYALYAGTVIASSQPNITSLGNLSSANVIGNLKTGNANLGNLAKANYFQGDGYLLANLTGGNVTGQVANANIADQVYTANQPNITGVGTLANLTIAGTGFITGANSVTSNYFIGNGSLLTALTGANVTGFVANATVANTVRNAAQPNITSVGTLANITATGNIDFTGTSNVLLGSVANVKITGGTGGYVLTTDGSGNVSWESPSLVGVAGANTDIQFNDNGAFGASANLTFNKTSNTLTVDKIVANGVGLTSITGANVTGTVANANYAAYAGNVINAVQPNITSVGTLTNTTLGAANSFTGGNLVSANYITGTLTSSAQPNITQVGTLANLNVTGNISSAANIIGANFYGNFIGNIVGNLDVTGGNTQVIFNDQGNANASANFTFNKATNLLSVTGNIQRDSKNVPTFASATTAPSNPRMGDEWYDQANDILYKYFFDGTSYYWVDTTSGYISANVSASANTLVQRDSNGNVTANYFIGNGSMLTGVGSAGGLSNGTSNITAGTVNGNITVGISGVSNTVVFTTTGMNVIATGGINAGNIVTANYFTGSGNLLSNIQASNITGTVANANYSLYAGTVLTNAQPNITSVGTLSNLTSGGTVNFITASNVSLGSNANVKLTGGTTGQYLQTDGTGNLSWATIASGSLSNGTSNITAGTVNGNITVSIGGTSNTVVFTSTGINVAGYVNTGAGNIIGGNITSNGGLAATGTISGNNLSISYNINTIGGNISSGANIYASGNISATANIQGANITSNGLLSVIGNANVGNLGTNGLITAIGNISGANLIGPHANGNSNVSIAANANISLFVAGNTTAQLIAASTGVNIAGYANIAGNANVGNLGSGGIITAIGNVQGGNFTTSGIFFSSVVTGTAPIAVASTTRVANLNVSYSNVSDYSNTVAQTTGTFYPTFVSGSTSGNYQIGSNANINVSLATGTFNANLVGGTLTTPAQPNITSVGTLTSLTVTGNATVGNLIGVFANGNSNINIPSANGNIQLSVGGVANVVTITTTGITVGTATSGNITNVNYITANYFSGSGNLLSNIQAANITGTVANANYSLYAGTVLTNAQPNITSVGTLSGLTATGTINFTTASNVSLGSNANVKLTGGTSGQYLYTDGTGNLSWGTIATAAVANGTSNVSIPTINGNVIIGVGGNNTVTVTTTGANVTGYLNVSGNITSGANVSATNANLGNLVTANYFSGAGNLLSNIQAANITGTVANANYSLYAGTVLTNAQPNITSVGSLVSLTVTGNISSGNANLGNLVTANYFSGSGNLLSNIQASNITGTIANANYAAYVGNVINASQSNITQVGTLANLNVTGNISSAANITAANANLGNLVTANYFSGAGNLLSNIQAANITGTVANANYAAYAGNIINASQSNITLVGTLANLNVTGNISSAANITAANASLGNLVSANYFSGSGNLLSNVQAANITGTIANANYAAYAGNVVNATQSNITVVGTLANLNVTGNISSAANITAANANLGNLVTANYHFGDGGLLSNIAAANIVGTVANANYAAYTGNVINAVQSNITQVGTLASVNVTANANVGNLNTAGNVNITNTLNATGTGTGALIVQGGASVTKDLYVGGTIYAPNYAYVNSTTLDANASLLYLTASPTYPYTYDIGFYSHFSTTGLPPGNGYQHTGFVRDHADNYWYLFSNAAEPSGGTVDLANANLVYDSIKLGGIVAHGEANISGNITSAANIIATNANLGNLVTANFFTGSGNLLSNIQASNITGTIANANYAAYAGNVVNASQSNITSVGTLNSLTATGTINFTTASNVSLGSNSNVKITGGTSGAVLQTDGTGNLTWASAGSTGISGSNTQVQYNNAGSFGASANFTFNNTNNTLTVDKIVANGAGLTSITGANVTGFVPNANVANTAYSVSGSNVSGPVAFATVANSVAGANVSGVVANANYAAYAGNVINATQSNITLVGTLANLNVTGNISSAANITAANASLGNLVTANYFSGNGSLLTGVAASSATTAGTVTTNAQPNITSVGTLVNLNVAGNITAANASLGNLVVANYFSGNGSLLTSITGANVTGTVANANYASYTANVINAVQSNITQVGTLANLNVTGNITSGANITATNANLGNLVVANYFSGDGGLLSNIASANITGTVANANYAAYAGNVINAVQSNITQVGTLANLTVTANITSGNANLGNLATANYFTGNGSLLTAINGSNVTGTVANATYATSAGSATTAATVTASAQPNITSVGTLSSVTVSGTTNLGAVGNITISGGSSGYVLATNGYGLLSWQPQSSSGMTGFVGVTQDDFTGDNSTTAFHLSSTPSSSAAVVVNIDGLIQQSSVYSLSGSTVNFTTAPLSGQKIEITSYSTTGAGSNTEVLFNNNGNVAGATNFTFDSSANVLTVGGNITANTITANANIVASGGYLTLNGGIIAVAGSNAGLFTSIISNVNIGLSGNVVLGASSGNVTARGNLIANTITANTSITSNLITATNIAVNNFYSNRAAVSVPINTSTIIDVFPVSLYRTAKYTIRVNSDAGYQSIEALLIHDSANALITVYGSISTSGSDIVLLSADINTGNVELLALSSTANTAVNLIGTYVADN